MLKPPFKLASSLSSAALDAGSGRHVAGCCDAAEAAVPAAVEPPNGRARLGELDPHLHCSVIGTCMGTDELRKLMARFVFVRDMSDLDVDHEAVAMAAQGGPVTKALQKALDRRHESTVQRFGRAGDAQAVAALWDDALRQGEVPGAYWAVLTHRATTAALRKRAFGDVHMLSHLVGAANRADVRRLGALEQDNAELRERLERQQARAQEATVAHQAALARLERALADAQRRPIATDRAGGSRRAEPVAARVAVQTERRERAEHAATVAAQEASRLREELAHLGRHVQSLGSELAAAEAQLRQAAAEPGAPASPLARALRGLRILYAGGRPSSTPAIRDLVLGHGGEFQHHDGGFEDRKGLLASGVARAALAVFPVDCIDHDSASNLKRLCTRLGVAFLPLRSASVASFAAALANPSLDADRPGPPFCVGHG